MRVTGLNNEEVQCKNSLNLLMTAKFNFYQEFVTCHIGNDIPGFLSLHALLGSSFLGWLFRMGNLFLNSFSTVFYNR